MKTGKSKRFGLAVVLLGLGLATKSRAGDELTALAESVQNCNKDLDETLKKAAEVEAKIKSAAISPVPQQTPVGVRAPQGPAVPALAEAQRRVEAIKADAVAARAALGKAMDSPDPAASVKAALSKAASTRADLDNIVKDLPRHVPVLGDTFRELQKMSQDQGRYDSLITPAARATLAETGRALDSAPVLAVSQMNRSQLGGLNPVAAPSPVLDRAVQNWQSSTGCNGSGACTKFERDDRGGVRVIEHTSDGTTRAWQKTDRGVEMAERTATGSTRSFIVPPPTVASALQKAPAVGGVRLGFALDVLKALDSATAVGQGSATTLNGDFKIVSVNALMHELKLVGGDFDRLPETARELGHISRIYGYMIDPATQDLILLGEVRPGEPGIPAKDLVTGLQAVYYAGAEPAVSLDPAPSQPAGPQITRVIGVPKDSHFAGTLLDGDYQMKRILFGSDAVHLAGFRTLADLLIHQPTPPDMTARFWITPLQPSGHDLHTSPRLQQALFFSKMQVLTEQMSQSQSGFLGTGRVDPIAEQAAQSFTANYPEIESRYPVFRRVHALADVALLATVLRYTGVQIPALTELIAFVPRGEHDVKAWYPGIERVFGESEGRVYSISGGAVLAQRVSQRVFDSYSDDQTRRLADAAHRLASSGQLVGDAGLNTIVIASPNRDADVIQRAVSRSQLLLANGSYQDAAKELRAATSGNPRVPELYGLLALAYTGAKDFSRAEESADRAIQLAPHDEEMQQIRYEVLLEVGRTIDLRTVSKPVGARLATGILRQAALEAKAGNTGLAEVLCGRAMVLDPQNSLSYLVRGGLRLMNQDYTGALEDFMQGTKVDPASPALYAGRGMARYLTGDSAGALEDAKLAIRYGDLPMAHVSAGLVLVGLKDYNGALHAVNQAILSDPSYAAAYASRCVVYAGMHMPAEAIKDCTVALQKQPANVDALWQRSELRRETGDYRGSIEDATRIVQMHPAKVMLLGAYSSRGQSQVALRQFTLAEQDFTSAIAVLPDVYVPWMLRSDVRRRLHKWEPAIDDVNRAIKLMPSEREGLEELRGIIVKQELEEACRCKLP